MFSHFARIGDRSVMATPRLTPAQIAQVPASWPNTLQPSAKGTPPVLSRYLYNRGLPWTDSSLPSLDGTRLLVLQGERVANPDFYPMLRSLGFNNLPDQSAMAAITFCDVVVSHEPLSNGLLFHELVHVEQYRQLGIPRFSELHVRGFLNGGSYEAIPLEVNAYTLGGRFEQNTANRFPVEDEVRRWIAEGRL